VIGLTYLLEQTPLNAEQAAYLKQINVASNLLLAVITDVLDLSKIEAGELQIATAAFSPQRLLDGLASIMSVQAAAKGIALEFDMPEGLPAALLGDAPRLTQILTNLLSNAIKFTERGGVSLSVRPIATSATGVTLRFTVKDTGIGIEAAAQARLFTPFVQVDESIARRYGGTGLGLSIVNNLAKLLGGRVTVSSSPGVGSEFCVELAFALAAAAELSTRQPSAATPATRTLAGVRVLVVDDSELNLTVTKRILEHHGSHVELAHDGPDALQLLRASPGGFDVVLMDVQMPILDGYETTRRVRTELGLVNLPIIALTAGALSSESRRAAAVGMNGFIIKPFDAPGLINTIKRHARLAKAGVAVPQPGPAARPVTVATATTAAATATATAQGDGWPHIDGIDTADARGRWCGDLPLFRTMLGQWLKEFSGVTLPAEAIDAESLSTTHAARLHKLRGGACMLGATALQRLAAEAEAACVAGEAARAAQIVVQLAAELERLQIAAASAFAAAPATLERGFPAADGGPEPVALAALVAMLRQNRLSARDRFRDSAPQLKRLLGEKGFLRVRAQIDNLEFDAAADALEAAA